MIFQDNMYFFDVNEEKTGKTSGETYRYDFCHYCRTSLSFTAGKEVLNKMSLLTIHLR